MKVQLEARFAQGCAPQAGQLAYLEPLEHRIDVDLGSDVRSKRKLHGGAVRGDQVHYARRYVQLLQDGGNGGPGGHGEGKALLLALGALRLREVTVEFLEQAYVEGRHCLQSYHGDDSRSS